MSGFETTSLKDALLGRRSIYALQATSKIPDARIRTLVEQAVLHSPSSFNSQSTRLVVLLKDDHRQYWDIVTDILKAQVPAEKWEHTRLRLEGFRGGYGTILFYEDPAPVKALQAQWPTYSANFPTWAEHTSAIHQFVLWAALEAEGLGANLQHYGPLPDARASATWGIPADWSNKAQLVFGDIAPGTREQLREKSFEPLDKRVFVHGAAE